MVWLDRTKCTACSACVDACPHEAVVFPGYTGEEVAAHVEALLDPTVGPRGRRGIAYVCEGASWDPSWHPAWLPVSVACVNWIPSSWILAPLLRGAACVAVAPCTCGRAEAAGGLVERRLDFCEGYVRTLGLGETRVHRAPLSVAPPEEPLPRGGDEGTLFGTGPEVAAGVLQRLAEVAGRSSGSSTPPPPCGS
ncbi:MAG: 4Fe-4S binding protein [Armatimonadetes bacterium]|nr:4Fe-4S binding protein [Armatimonadota bacterium]MDW8154327.1 4Fe-4S binding protein [Armatimonadota bacterium]